MNSPELLQLGEAPKIFSMLYDTCDIDAQKKRYLDLIQNFYKRLGSKNDIRIFSSPGRSEIGGNHTAHNNCKALGASIMLDCIAVIVPTADNKIYITDYTYNEDYQIDLNTDLQEVLHKTKDSRALICGIANGFKKEGLNIGGFKGCFTSSVIPAAGVSSSAAFEMLIC